MTDWGASGRKDTFRATLCDVRTLQDVEDIDIVPGGSSITWALDSETYYTGDIEVAADLGNVTGRLLRIYHSCKVDDYDRERPIATMFIKSTARNVRYKSEDSKVSGYSTLLRFSEDKLIDDFYRAPGTSILQGIQELVTAEGGILYVEQGVEDRNYEQEHFFEVEQSRLEVIKTMAGWINAEIYPSARGYVHLRPKMDAAIMEPAYSFTETNCTYLPGVDIDDGREDVYNRSVAICTTKDYTERHVEESPSSNPFSFEVSGRHRTIFTKLTDREYSKEELARIAADVLHENDGSIKYVTIEHVFIPTLTVGDVVTYSNSVDFVSPFSAKCVIMEMSPSALEPGMLCRSKLKVVG